MGAHNAISQGSPRITAKCCWNATPLSKSLSSTNCCMKASKVREGKGREGKGYKADTASASASASESACTAAQRDML